MSKQYTAQIGVYTLGLLNKNIDELKRLDGDEIAERVSFLDDHDRSDSDWVRIGSATVTFTFDDDKTVIANQVAGLRGNLKRMRAEHQRQEARLEDSIQKLLALENEVTA